MKSFYAQKWLDTAKWAASGGNAQPWDIEFDEKPTGVSIRLAICAEYSKNPSAMDKGGEASVMALGCLAVNLEIMANLDKYELSHKLWDLQKNFWTSSVTLFFTQNSNVEAKYSIQDILQRKTDRTAYKKTEIAGKTLVDIRLIVRKYEILQHFEFNKNRKELAPALLEIEKLRWKNSELLQSLVSEVSFGKDEKAVLDKIPSSQLGVPFMDVLLLRTLKLFPKLTALFKWGLHQIASRKSLANYIKHSDRLFFIQAKANDFQCCFDLGSCFQEIWLQANKNGVAFQPLGLPLIPLAYWNHPNALVFTQNEKNMIEQLTDDLSKKFEMNLRLPMMGLRMGYPNKVPQKSPRKEIIGKVNPALSSSDYSKSEKVKQFGF